MSEREALLRAVCENPDDDTPRLVFADWLDEHGEAERAEFIRVHVEAGKEESFFDHSPQNPASARAKSLLETYGRVWMEGVPTTAGVNWMWKRGFPGWLQVRGWQALKPMIPRVVGRWPVEHLEFDSLTRRGAELLGADPFAGRIRYLRLHWFRNMPTLAVLLNSRLAAGLTHLCLRHADLGDHGAWIVSNSEALSGLRYLNLDCCGIDDPGVRALCRSPYLSKDIALDMERNLFSEGLEGLVKSTFRHAAY